jgi:hypothetical protein
MQQQCCDIGNENVNPNSHAPAVACVENFELSFDTKSVRFFGNKIIWPLHRPIKILHYKQFKLFVFASKFKLKFDGVIGKQIIKITSKQRFLFATLIFYLNFLISTKLIFYKDSFYSFDSRHFE